MGTMLILLFALLAFALAAMRWGYTSVDGPESREWARREQKSWWDGETSASAPGATGCADVGCGGECGSLCG